MTIARKNRETIADFSFCRLRGGSLLVTGLILLSILAGCASSPQPTRQSSTPAPLKQTSNAVVRTALAQLDRPYRYGGDSPRGFDCSGLVYYAHLSNGIPIPRTTRDQHRRADPVSQRELAPGDLLFFRETRRKPSHVGLYVGGGRFIHASTSEQAVTLSRLSNPYWQKHLLGAGRYKP